MPREVWLACLARTMRETVPVWSAAEEDGYVAATVVLPGTPSDGPVLVSMTGGGSLTVSPAA